MADNLINQYQSKTMNAAVKAPEPNVMNKNALKSTSDKSKKKVKSDTDALPTYESGKKNNTGALQVAFGGRMSAEIIRSIIDTFIYTNVPAQTGTAGDIGVTSLLYNYSLASATDNVTVRDLLDVYIPDERGLQYIQENRNVNNLYSPEQGYYGKVFNPDESMMPSPTQYLGWNGSILAMIEALSNRPFNELYWTHEEGKATMHYRQTPFEENDWESLDIIQIPIDDVLSFDVDQTNQEQYSIFKLSSSSEMAAAPFSKGYPVTDDKQELMRRYGYKTMEVQSEYFDNSQSKDNKVTDDTTGDTIGTQADNWGARASQEGDNENQSSEFYPPFGVVDLYPEIDSKDMLSGDNNSNAKLLDLINNHYQIDSYYGGQELYEDILDYLNKNTLSPQQTQIDGINNLIENYFSTKNAVNPIGGQAGKTITTLWNTNNSLSKYSYVTQVLPQEANPLPLNSSTGGYGSLYYVLGNDSDRQKHPVQAASDIVVLSKGRIGTAQAAAIVDAMNNGTWDKNTYIEIMTRIRHDAVNKSVAETKNLNSPDTVYMKYQNKLFNWYADNSKFMSGTVTTTGRTDVEYGKRLLITDPYRDQIWEFYVEGVDHNFDFSTGWTTDIVVTRGLLLASLGDDIRFRMFWGHYAPFQGNFFGEGSLASLVTEADANYSSDEDGGSDSSSNATGPNVGASGKVKEAIGEALNWASKSGLTYSSAAHEQGLNIYSQSGRIATDCSGFIYCIYNHVGLNFDSPWESTWAMAKDSHFTTVSASGSNKEDAFNSLHNGDLVFFNTAGQDGHIGIYVGNGSVVAWNGGAEGETDSTSGAQKFNMKDPYWWSSFSGHIIRAK